LLPALQLALWMIQPSASSVVQVGKEVQVGCILMSEKRESSRLFTLVVVVPVSPKGGNITPKDVVRCSGRALSLGTVTCCGSGGSGGGGIVVDGSPICWV
jgi:hypothetical protein